MAYCAICENEFSDDVMKEIISKKGIVKVCPGCFRDDMLVFEKPSPEKLEGIYARKSVYSRLSDAAGLKDPEEHKRRISEFGKDSGVIGNESLKRIVNKAYDEKAKRSKNEDLIDNFHWVIMRARRNRKISQKQLALEIQEPESMVAMAERGIIQPGNDFFVKKLEQFLRIRISKNKVRDFDSEEEKLKEELLKKFEESGEFDPLTTKTLTIEDLQSLNENKKRKKWWKFGKKDKDETEVEIEDLDFDSDSPFFRG